MSRKKPVPFVVDADGGVLLVMSKFSGINPLVVMIDQIPIKIFPGERVWYHDVDTVIEWHQKELKASNGASGNKKVLECLKVAKAKFIAGKCRILDGGAG